MKYKFQCSIFLEIRIAKNQAENREDAKLMVLHKDNWRNRTQNCF